ncbi:hypothetical protein Gpo141_00000022 [Globisporangium polare]
MGHDDVGAAAVGDAVAHRPLQAAAPDHHHHHPVIESSSVTTTDASTIEDNGDDTIAARTRTKFSLVDVPIDTLESFLPDAVEPILGEEQDREYQRFLSSLLPQEQENLSFLDEEDEEYEPPEDEDEDDAEVASDNAKERMTVKISKKELTELLWDSSRLGVSLSGPPGNISSSSIGDHGQMLSAIGGFTGAPAFNGPGMGMPALVPAPGGMAAGNPPSAPMLFPPPPIVFPGSLRFLRPGDGTQPPQDLHGTITQEQCIQLASQMHKHVQLLLQNLHLFASSTKASSSSITTDSTGTDNSVNDEATKRLQAEQSALDECRKMIEELQSRGERAQQCKGALLAKLNPGLASSASSSSSQQEILGSRRVTRSLTAAHAAVAHPSMFELVGSYALDELSSKFQDNCSLQERNSTIKEQMLEIDNHLLATKKKNPKKPFTHSEDNLLAHGVKRFATHADSWSQIEKNFLPGKPTNVIQRRYRYLASNKTGMSAVKEYHSQFPKRRDASWILEEDLRIARGLIEFHNDNRRFARVGMNYLPHRSRLEIRKRWERLRQRFYPQVAELSPGIDDTSIDFTVLVKDLLEDKLRDQVKEQSKKILDTELSGGGDNDSTGSRMAPNGKGSAQVKPGAGAEVKQEGVESTGATRRAENPNKSACTVKNLHPALFFTSWALINPAVLLSRTCEHNWPSFIDDMSAQPKEPVASSPAAQIAVSEAMVGVVSAEAPRVQAKSGAGVRAVNSEPFIPAGAAQARRDTSPPASAYITPELTRPVAASKRAKPASPGYDSEPSTANTSALLDEDEDDDSDYEHDELVSSEDEGENASDSEEFEQLELSDDEEEEDLDDNDDDDDDEDESFDYEELEDSGEGEFDLEDDEEAEEDTENDEAVVRTVTPRKPTQAKRQSVSTPVTVSSTATNTPTAPQPQSQQQQTTPPVRHPLRLQNLQKPGNERMKRLLAALERRIVGKSVHSPAGQANAVIPPAARPSGEKRRISRVPLETTQSLGPTRAYGSPIPFGSGAPTPAQSRGEVQGHIPSQAPAYSVPDDHEPLVPDFDLETSEELESLSSSDDDFECEELSGGSSIEDDVDDEDDDDENALDTLDDDEDGEEDGEWLRQGTMKASGRDRQERLATSVAAATHVVIQPRLQQQRGEVWTPNKKIKLLLPNDTVCQRCGGKRARCGCSVML